jgi:hypothetical protein
VVGNTLGSNGGYGLRLDNADNTFIAANIVTGNSAGSIYIDADSTGVVTIANRTDTPITHEQVGSGFMTLSWQSSQADSDCDVATYC